MAVWVVATTPNRKSLLTPATLSGRVVVGRRFVGTKVLVRADCRIIDDQ